MKTVNVCTNGECNGECYRCRLRDAGAERDRFGALIVRLYDAGIVSGVFGPWADLWTEQDKALWEEFDTFRKRFE